MYSSPVRRFTNVLLRLLARPFPLPHSSSIIGLGGLNFRVRYGNGCGPSGKATGNFLQRDRHDSRDSSRVLRTFRYSRG